MYKRILMLVQWTVYKSKGKLDQPFLVQLKITRTCRSCECMMHQRKYYVVVIMPTICSE